jgi:uncharacterized membrane protein YphA (DoxX/SURF4 family)
MSVTLFLLRIVAGLLFLQAGGMKIFDWFGGVPAEFGGHPAVGSQTWIGGGPWSVDARVRRARTRRAAHGPPEG